jgi:hypothetical protein
MSVWFWLFPLVLVFGLIAFVKRWFYGVCAVGLFWMWIGINGSALHFIIGGLVVVWSIVQLRGRSPVS